MKVESVREAGADAYAELVAGYPNAMVYHTPAYLSYVGGITGARNETLLAMDEGVPVAALPVLALDGPHGTVYNSLPFFGSNGGILGTDPAARAALAGAFCDLAEGDGVLAATLIESPLERDDELAPADYEDERISMLTALSRARDREAAQEEVMDRMQPPGRRNIRKAWDHGVEARRGQDAMEEVIALHHEAMDAVGGTSKPDAFFDLLDEHFEEGEDYDLFTAHHGGEVVGALLVFYHALVAEYYLPVVDRDRGDLQATPLLILEALVESSLRGHQWFNWGGTWKSQEGVYRFKRKFGVVESTYRYFTFTDRGEELEGMEEDALLEAYPGFFVIPFSALEDEG